MPPLPTGKTKSKLAEAPPEEDLEFVPIGEHERLLSIFISGRFARKASPPSSPQHGDASEHALPPQIAVEPSPKRSGTPTAIGAAGKRTGTPNKKETVAADTNRNCCALANGTYTNFPFAPELNRPFFSLLVPGIESIGGSQPTTSEAMSAATLTAGAARNVPPSVPKDAKLTSGKEGLQAAVAISDPALRIIPKGDEVNPDGSFKIEMYRKKLRIDPNVIEKMFSKQFRLQVHTVPDVSVMAAKYASAVAPSGMDLNSTTRKAGKATTPSGGGVGQGGAANKNNRNKVAVDPVELSQDPLTVPWLDANTLLSHNFDLSQVFDKSAVDRIELVSDEGGTMYESTNTRLEASSASLSAGGTTLPPMLDTQTPATRATLTKSHGRKTILYSQALPGFESLIVSIVCSDPLLSPNNLKRYLPMVVEISQITNLPSLSAKSIDLRHTMVPRQDELTFSTRATKFTNTSSSLATKTVGPQFKPVRVSFNGVRDYEQPYSTLPHPHARDIDFRERFIIFLSKYSTLELHEHLFFKGLKFCLHDREIVGDEPTDTYKPPRAFGVAEIPLKGALAGETVFNVNAQIVPRTEAGSGDSNFALSTADYISNCTTIKAKIRFLTKLPSCHYVTPQHLVSPFPVQGPFSAKCHLSRVVFVLPYKAPNSQRVLQALMGVLMQYVKASETSGAVVEQRRPVPSRPVSPEEEIGLHQRTSSGLQSKAKTTGAGGTQSGKPAKKGVEESEIPTAEEERRQFEESLPPIVDDATFLVPEGVSGFEIMDRVQRVICLEGYVYMLYRVVEVVARVIGDSDSTTHILFNTDLAFPQRWYHHWPPLVKPIPHMTGRNGMVDSSATKLHSEPSTPRPPTASIDVTDQSPKTKEKKGAKPPKLTPAQKQALAEAAELEQKRLAKEKEAEEAEAVEKARKAALRGDRDELDSGGVGGRIRRMKLARPLDELLGQQRNFMKRFLSHEALTCINKLNNLRHATSLVHAVDHGFFPTAEELIALERVQGDTLEVFDICGAEKFYMFNEGLVEHAVEEADKAHLEDWKATQVKKEATTLEILSAGLNATQIGRMMNFVATPAHPSQLKRLPKLSQDYFPRHPHKNYMVITGASNEPLTYLCCYPSVPPSQLLRYHCNAQVIGAVESADSVELMPVLFVLHCETVAKNGSDDRNLPYEEHLRREKRRAGPKDYNRIMAQKRAHYMATHSASSKTRANQYGDSDEEDAPGFQDPPPYAPENAKEKEELIENLLVRNDYVTLNKDATQTLRQWGKPVNEAPRQQRAVEAELNAKYQKLYDNQSRRLEAIDAKIASSIRRADHPQKFVSGNAKTTEEAHRHPKFIRPEDVSAPASEQPQKSPNHSTSLPPMSFYGGRTAIEETNLDDLLPSAFKSRLEAKIANLTSVEEAAAAHQRRKDAEEEWRAKVVVDSTHFSVSTKHPRDKPLSSIDQYRSILEDEPMKPTIKRNYVPPAPPSIRTAERLVPNPRIEPNECKHPERRTFYLAKHPKERPFYKDIPMVSDDERDSSPLYHKRQ